jgi:hypothetical protein
MERVVYKIDNDNDNDNNNESNKQIDILSNLKIIEILPIQDTLSDNKLIINKLCIDNGHTQSKLFIETSYLQVFAIEDNKLHLKLPPSHISFFNQIDDKCTELLGDLVNGESDLEICNFNELTCNSPENFDLYNIEYKSLISSTNSDTMKINIFSGTTIKYGTKEIDKSKINIGDTIRLVIGLDYISLLVDTLNIVARTKIYSYFIDVSKKYNYIPQSREKINNWVFSSNSNNSNVFIKTNTTNDDNFDVNTEMCISNNFNSKQNKINNKNISEKIIESCENIIESCENMTESSETVKLSESENSIVLLEPNEKIQKYTLNNDISNINNSIVIEQENLIDTETSSVGKYFENNNVIDNISYSENIKLLSSLIKNNDNNLDEIINEEKFIQQEQENFKTNDIKISKTIKKTQEKKPNNRKSINKKNINIESNVENNEITKVEETVIELENKVKPSRNKKSLVKQETEKKVENKKTTKKPQKNN